MKLVWRRRRGPSLTKIERWIEEGILALWDENVRAAVLLTINGSGSLYKE